MKAKIRAAMNTAMNLTAEDRAKLAEWLVYKQVEHIIGKRSTTIKRLLKEGRLDKIGFGRSARISLKSVLRYLEEERRVAEVARTVPNTTMAKAREWARRKRQEDKIARALEIVNAGGAAPATPGNPNGDPGLEPCVFEGIAMSVSEREEILEKRWREQQPRRYTFSNIRGV